MLRKLISFAVLNLLATGLVAHPVFAVELNKMPLKPAMQGVPQPLPSTATTAGTSTNAIQPQIPGAVTDPTLVLDTLRAQNKRLKDTLNNLKRLQAQSIKDGQLICSDDATSSNMQGVTRDCSPYACDASTGSCRSQAATSYDCASGFYWENGRCVRPPPPPPGGDCGFFCL